MGKAEPHPHSEGLRYLYVTRVRCPHCQSLKLETIRSIDQGDGSRHQRKRCRDCGRRFVVILE